MQAIQSLPRRAKAKAHSTDKIKKVPFTTEELFTMAEAAALLGIGYQALSEWLNDADIAKRPICYRRGTRYIRFSSEHIAQNLKSLECGGAK